MNYSVRTLFAVLLLTSFSVGCATRQNLPLGEVPPLSPPAPNVQADTKRALDSKMAGRSELLPSSAPQVVRVARIVRRLKAAAGGSEISYPIYVFDAGSENVNAMVVNGSAILVYKALVDRVDNDEQLAAVLAHEMGHLSGKHADDKGEEERSKWVQLGSTVIGVAAAVAVAAAGGNAAQYAGDIGESAMQISHSIADGGIVKAYSRSMEYEADQIGLVLMARAGYRPDAALDLWKNSERILATGNDGPSFFSSHPSADDRLEKLSLAMPVAMQNFKEQTPAEKIEEARLDKLQAKEAQDIEEAKRIYEKALKSQVSGDQTAALKAYKSYLSVADKYRLDSPEVSLARSSVSFIERKLSGRGPDPVSAEEREALDKIEAMYRKQNTPEGTIAVLMDNYRTLVPASYESSADRLKLYYQVLQQSR